MRVGFLATGVAAGGGSVWVISQSAAGVKGAALSRIDPSSNTVVGSVALGAGVPVGVALGAGSVWVASREPNAVVRVEPLAATGTRSWLGDSLAIGLGMAALALVLAAWLRRTSPPPAAYAPPP